MGAVSLTHFREAVGRSRGVASIRRVFRASEAALVGLAVLIGIGGGLLTLAQNRIAHAFQSIIYGLNGESLSASASVWPGSLAALPLGGLALGLILQAAARRWSTPVDIVEANALHGGAIPLRDTLLVCGQTLLSNGAGASVGLEAAYGQAGGGLASLVGQWLRLRRRDMRVLLGAGAGAAIAAAFSAPLTGAFYAFEIVIGAYTPAAIAPVATAALSGVLTARLLGLPAYLIALPGAKAITTADYLVYAALGVACAAIAVIVMRGITIVEQVVRGAGLPEVWRPAVGGLLLIPLALITPQALSAGHGALHMDLGAEVGLQFLLIVFVVKIVASTVSLGFGFRGGLFFASLFIGSVAGTLFAGLVAHVPGLPPIDPADSALIGMAAMGVAIVGGPMTMSLLVLETTHDFALTGVALTAGLCASTVVRETFGFSFSTWRLHVRGHAIRSPRDVGWMRSLSVGKMMQRAANTAPATTTVGEFRRRFPLGSTSTVVLIDDSDRYAGLVETSKAFDTSCDEAGEIGALADLRDVVLKPAQDVRETLAAFEQSEADYLAVVDETGQVLGTLSEKFVQRRYADELEKAQREMFGE
jgi:CIC family chloride channel protein